MADADVEMQIMGCRERLDEVECQALDNGSHATHKPAIQALRARMDAAADMGEASQIWKDILALQDAV